MADKDIYISDPALREMRARFGITQNLVHNLAVAQAIREDKPWKPREQTYLMPDGRKRAYWFYTLRDFAGQGNVIQTKLRQGSFGDVARG